MKCLEVKLDNSSRRKSARPPLHTGKEGPGERIKRLLVGPPRDLNDSRIFHRISLIAFLAWIGLGADGLSSSCYGPEEAFRTLGEHKYLAILLAAAMAFTVTIIAMAYSRVIEHFPFGGGGYVVATKLLGNNAGMVSGSALLVDYVLTIAISIAAAGDALFSFFPVEWRMYALPTEALLIIVLTLVNLRGVKESIILLAPIFVIFLITHCVLIRSWDRSQGYLDSGGFQRCRLQLLKRSFNTWFGRSRPYLPARIFAGRRNLYRH